MVLELSEGSYVGIRWLYWIAVLLELRKEETTGGFYEHYFVLKDGRGIGTKERRVLWAFDGFTI